MTIIERLLTMCDDCALIIANDDDSSMSEAQVRAHTLAMFHHTKTWVGQIVVDSHAADFSTRHCDTCGTTDAGSRWDGVLLAPVKGEPKMALVTVSL